MKNKTASIPMGMLMKKFYCHKCGERLQKHPHTRTLRPGDPDYRKHNRINHRTHMVGDVDVTEYEFRCPACGTTTEYDDQCVIAAIQKQLGKQRLSDEELLRHKEEAERKTGKRAKLLYAIFMAFVIAVILLILYLKLKSGDASFTVHF